MAESARYERQAREILAMLDAQDFDNILDRLSPDFQGVDEISRKWLRGRAASEGYFQRLREGGISDIKSEVSDVHVEQLAWGIGLVTMMVHQSYVLDGSRMEGDFPITMMFKDTRLMLVSAVPLPPE